MHAVMLSAASLPLTALCWRTPFPSTDACFTHRGLVWRRFGYSSVWETADTDVWWHHSFKSRLNREYREAGCDKKVSHHVWWKKNPTCQIRKFSNWIVFLFLFFTFKRFFVNSATYLQSLGQNFVSRCFASTTSLMTTCKNLGPEETTYCCF